MDVDARHSVDHCGPVMIQEQALAAFEPLDVPDPWSGWAKLVDPAPVEDEQVEAGPAAPSSAAPPASADDDLVAAVAQLVGELADERRRRAASDVARREAD